VKEKDRALIKIFIFIMLLSFKSVQGQERIAEIKFEGLNHTKTSFLKQYLTSKVGEIYDSVQLKQDQQRLINLGTLAEVKAEIKRDKHDVTLLFSCVEMINLLPVLAFGQTSETFWFRAGLEHLNFTGRGDKIFAYYQYFDRHSVFLNYSTDRIGNSKWGLSASLIRWATIEPLKMAGSITKFNYTNYTGYASIVRFLSFRETVESGIGFFNEIFESRDVSKDKIPSIVQGDKLLSKLIFKSNHLNYNSFLVAGFYNQLNIEIIHSLDEVRNFAIVFNDLRYFKKIGKRLNWANRLRVGIATNDANPFAPFVLDSYLNIRGVGNRVDRGTGSVVLNTELRYTIFDIKKFAAQGVGFVDFGFWRKPNGNFGDFTKSENKYLFSGLGIRLIYKRAFDTMIRVDYGYNFDKNAGWIIGIGQFF